MSCLSIFLLLLLLLSISCNLHAQAAAGENATADSPQALATLVLQRFASGSLEEFEAVYPDPRGRDVLRSAIEKKSVRQGNLGRVIWNDSQHAVLLLTGTVVAERSGQETVGSRHFSGLYEAENINGRWSLKRAIPLDADNHILSQTIHASLDPGKEIEVDDQIGISVGSKYGFAVRLNDRSNLKQVRMDDKQVEYAFGGGVLWIQSQPTPRGTLSLTYSLAEDGEHKDDTGAVRYGDFQMENVWVPLFDYDSANDYAHFDITVRLPSDFRLATGLPQTETVQEGVRVVHGQSDEDEFSVTIVYDRDWRVTSSQAGDVRLESFLTPDFHWSHEQIAAITRDVYSLLEPRFGKPLARYIAAVEERDIGEHGFLQRADDMVRSGKGGGTALMSEANKTTWHPAAPLAHELSHEWTFHASGPAANFLREGWAVYATWTFLGSKYGPEVEQGIWETMHNNYFLGRNEGAKSILGNPDNGSIHYVKGSWLLHMLEETLGQQVFDRGMRTFIAIPHGQPAGYEQFIAAMSSAAGRDMQPVIMPWLSGKYVPNIEVKIAGNRLLITQNQPEDVFDLPLQLALITSSGRTVEKSVHLTQRSQTVDLGISEPVTQVRIDPHHQLLVQRRMGERVKFELHAPAAKAVSLAGSFTIKPIPANRDGDTWRIELPLSEGRYDWAWEVDGKQLDSDYEGQPGYGARIVQPLERLAGAYPQ